MTCKYEFKALYVSAEVEVARNGGVTRLRAAKPGEEPDSFTVYGRDEAGLAVGLTVHATHAAAMEQARRLATAHGDIPVHDEYVP